MEFGILKSRIEKKLYEAYSNNNLKKEFSNFKKYILENNELKKVYYLYDELSKEKNFDKNFAEDFVNECVDIYKTINVRKESLVNLERWLTGVVCENEYVDIDNIFSNNFLMIESRIISKNNIVNKLSTEKKETEVINIEMDKMLDVANNTINNYLSQIGESEQKQIKKYLSLSENEVKNRYNILSEMTIEKLETLMNESDEDTKTKISETIEKIKSEDVNVISLVKLKNLNDDL
jgi:hypothetical protein